MTQLVCGRNDASLRHGSHDDMRSRTHSPLWNVSASTRGLDIRPGAGIAKNGEGERLGAAIRGDDVRFARQHDRVQFAGGVDECECIIIVHERSSARMCLYQVCIREMCSWAQKCRERPCTPMHTREVVLCAVPKSSYLRY